MAVALLPLAGQAEEFPRPAIRLIVGFAAGGLPDTVARIVAARLAEQTGVQVIVENRGGAGGIPATEAVARAAADGHTLLISDPSPITINPHVYARLPYDAKDLRPLGILGVSPLFLCVPSSMGVRSFPALVTLARRSPGAINYGSAGTGTVHHLATEVLKAALHLDLVHVPYKGTGQAVPALLAGQISVLFAALPSIESHVRSGRLVALGVSTPRRSQRFPELPTLAELGVPGFDFATETGVFAPGGTPPRVVSRLSAEFVRVVAHPPIARRLQELGVEPWGSTAAEHDAFIRQAVPRYAEAVRLSGAKAD